MYLQPLSEELENILKINRYNKYYDHFTCHYKLFKLRSWKVPLAKEGEIMFPLSIAKKNLEMLVF